MPQTWLLALLLLPLPFVAGTSTVPALANGTAAVGAVLQLRIRVLLPVHLAALPGCEAPASPHRSVAVSCCR